MEVATRMTTRFTVLPTACSEGDYSCEYKDYSCEFIQDYSCENWHYSCEYIQGYSCENWHYSCEYIQGYSCEYIQATRTTTRFTVLPTACRSTKLLIARPA